MDKRLLYLAAAVLATGIAGYAMWRALVVDAHSELAIREIRANVRQAVQASSETLKTIPTQLLEGMTVESIAAAFRHADISPSLSSADANALISHAAEFVYYRFINDSVDDYKAWMRSQGYALRPRESVWFLSEDHEIHFGEPPAPDADLEEIFDRFWNIGLASQDGANRPVSIAADRKGLVIVHGQYQIDQPGPTVQGELSADVWLAGATGRYRGWWIPRHGRDLRAVLNQFGSLDCARVAMVMQYADGSRRPLILTFINDPIDVRWYLYEAHGTVFLPEVGVGTLEY